MKGYRPGDVGWRGHVGMKRNQRRRLEDWGDRQGNERGAAGGGVRERTTRGLVKP